jgi:Uri superfamily endonuclease
MALSRHAQKILQSRMRKKMFPAPGTYSLIVKLEDDQEIEIGKLGLIHFKAGYYVYTGSALNNVEARIKYHRKDSKKLTWHIDYLLQYARITNVLVKKSPKKWECRINRWISALEKGEEIPKFGSSDCKCSSHLHWFKNNPIKYVRNMYSKEKH